MKTVLFNFFGLALFASVCFADSEPPNYQRLLKTNESVIITNSQNISLTAVVVGVQANGTPVVKCPYYFGAWERTLISITEGCSAGGLFCVHQNVTVFNSEGGYAQATVEGIRYDGSLFVNIPVSGYYGGWDLDHVVRPVPAL